MTYKKGYRIENKLIHIFEKYGFACVRSAGSKKVDIIAGKSNIKLCIEVKNTKNTYVYIPREQVEKLLIFSKKFGCNPLIIVNFKNKGLYVFDSIKTKLEINEGTKLETYIKSLLTKYTSSDRMDISDSS